MDVTRRNALRSRQPRMREQLTDAVDLGTHTDLRHSADVQGAEVAERRDVLAAAPGESARPPPFAS